MGGPVCPCVVEMEEFVNKQLSEAQARVERVTAQLETELGVGSWWSIKHKFSEGADGETFMPPDGNIPTMARTSACTVTQWMYRTAEITWYLPQIAITDDDKLEWIAIHEYVHMLNAPMATFLFDYLRDDEAAVEQIRSIGQYGRLEEYVTETLARVIQKSRGKDVPA